MHRLLLYRYRGPLPFGSLIQNASQSGDITKIFGVRAERQSLESLAMPLTAEEVQETDSQAEVTVRS